jgi:hypothetical protein
VDGLDFQLDIEQRLKGGEALTELEKIEAAYTDAKIANQGFSREVLKTQATLEKVSGALDETRASLLAAIKAGDPVQIQKLTTKYRELENEQTKLAGKLKLQQSALEKNDAELQKHATALGKAKIAEKQVEDARDRSDKKTEAYSSSLVKMTGRVGESADKISSMGNELGTVGALTELAATGTIALVAAVVAVGVAFAAAYVAVAQYAIGVANAKRNQEQTLRALTQSNDLAKELSGSFNSISKSTGVGGDQLLQYSRGLSDMRREMGLAQLSGAQYTKALNAAATASAALDDPAAGQAVIDQINAGLYTVDQLADRVDKRYSDVVKEKMLGLDQQLSKLKTNIAGIFSHFDITPFLTGLSRLVDLFDTNTASGKALQALFDVVFGPSTGDMADRFFIGLERWILKTELLVLVLAIKFKENWKKINDAIDSIHLGPFGTLRDQLNDLGGAASTAAFYVGALLNPITALTIVAPALGDTLGKSFAGIGMIIKLAYETGKQWVDKIAHFGTDMIDGIVTGLKNGEKRVVDALSGLLEKMHLGGQKTIEAHSPSKLAARELGEPIGQGVAQGIDSSQGDVSAALDNLLSLPAAPAAKGGGNGPSLTNTGNAYHFHGVENAEQASGKFFDKLLESLDVMADMGATEAPT